MGLVLSVDVTPQEYFAEFFMRYFVALERKLDILYFNLFSKKGRIFTKNILMLI